jgi:hypothetical protein
LEVKKVGKQSKKYGQAEKVKMGAHQDGVETVLLTYK